MNLDLRGGRWRRAAMAAAVAAMLVLGAAASPSAQSAPKAKAPKSGSKPAPGPPKLDAKAWILIDPRDGSVLASKARDRRLPIASTTKLMTAYLALHDLKPGQSIAAPVYHPSASAEITLGLQPGEKMRVRDLLYGLLLPSASDAAETLAVGISKSEPAFVSEMNRTAQSLGLTNTSYANPIGLDDPNNFSTAHDLVTLANLDLQNPLFARIVNTQAATLHSGDHPRQVTSRNTLLDRAPWVDGVKTGHTLKAGYVLVGSGTQNSTRLIAAVLGTSSEAARDNDTLELLDYGFSLYHPTQPVDQGEKLADPGLDYRSGHLPLVARRALRVSVRPGQRVGTQVNAPGEVSGLIKQGQVLGKVTVTVDGKPADSSPLVASESVGAATFFDKVVSAFKNPIFLLFLVAIVIVVGMLLSRRRREPTVEAAAIPRARRNGRQGPKQRTPEERRRMHQERMRRRRERMERKGGSG